MILASTILDSVSSTLLDTARRTWTLDDLLGYLNEALRTTSLVKPDIYVVELAWPLAAGVSQSLPADGTALIDIPRNTGGAQRVVTQVDKGLLDEAYRYWPAGTRQAQVEHFTDDPRNPLRFVVFPPNDGNGIVDLVYAAVPPEIMYADEEMPVPDSYQAPLTNYTLGKAYQMNAKRQDLAKASAYLQMWGQQLGLDAQALIAVLPKVASSPGTSA